MAKIQRPPAPRRPQQPPLPNAPVKKEPIPERHKPTAQPAKDHFLSEVAAAVYQNHPLVMLCTQPQIRKVAARVPIIKDVVDAFCPIVPGAAKILER